MLCFPWFLLLAGLAPAHSQQATSTRLIDDSYEYSLNQPDGIQYSSYWSPASGSTTTSRYNSTFHSSTTPGANLVYLFRGNSIYYYSDRGPSYTRGIVTVDNEDWAYINASAISPQYQQLLWSRTNLGSGDHQVIVTHVGTEGYNIGLDYFRVESDHGFVPESAGPNASVVPADAVFVDDTHSSLSYSSNWTAIRSTYWGGAYFDNSLHGTQHPGSTITFQFNGTAVWYFSDTDKTHGKVRVEMDGNFEATISGYSNLQLVQRLLWSKTKLSPGLHTVTLTHVDTDGAYMTLDFFRYLPSPSEALNSMAEPRTKTPMIAGIISGVVFFAVLISGWFYYRHRQSAQYNALNKTDLLDEDGHPYPAHHLSFVPTPYQTPVDQVPPRGNKTASTSAQHPSSYADSSVLSSISAPSGSSRTGYFSPQASPPPYARHPTAP